MSNLDDLADQADKTGFWDWFMKWFVRTLRLVSFVIKKD
jgi:hypothetical protein